MTKISAIRDFGLVGMAILLWTPSLAVAEQGLETTRFLSGKSESTGSYKIAQKASQSEAQKRKKQQQRQKAAQARKKQQQKAAQARKKQQQQKAAQARKKQQQQKAAQARKKQQQQKAAQARKKQQQQKAAQARKKQQQQKAAQALKKQRQQKAAQARKKQQQQKATLTRKRQQQQRLQRNARTRTVQRRRVQQRRQVKRNQQQFRKLQRRRTTLKKQINRNRNYTARLKRQNSRLKRQREWSRAQNSVHRRRVSRDFAFRKRARVLERRRDRTVFAALGGAAVGAAIIGSYYVYHNDDNRIDWRAKDVYVDDLDNGWTRNVVVRPDGVRVVTIRDGGGFIVRRYRVYPGNRVVMIYDNQPRWWSDGDLAVDVRPVRYSGPRERYIVEPSSANVDTVYDAIVADPVEDIDRTYTLNQVLMNANLRGYMPRIDLDTITFETGSSEIPEYQLDRLDQVGAAMEEAINENPEEVFLIEGHTDATGADIDNLTLSDERAAAVANALTEYYEIPPENLVTQGYGEEFLKVNTRGPSARNRRAAIRRITPLLANDSEDIALDSDGNEVFLN